MNTSPHIAGIFIRRRTHRGEGCKKMGAEVGMTISASQATSIAGCHQNLGESHGNDSPSEILERTNSVNTLISDFWLPEYISVALSHLVWETLFGQPWKPICWSGPALSLSADHMRGFCLWKFGELYLYEFGTFLLYTILQQKGKNQYTKHMLGWSQGKGLLLSSADRRNFTSLWPLPLYVFWKRTYGKMIYKKMVKREAGRERVCEGEDSHPSKYLFLEDKQKKIIVCKFKGHLISLFKCLSIHVAITLKSVVLRTTSLSDPPLMRLWPFYSLLVLFPNRCPCLSWKLPQIRREWKERQKSQSHRGPLQALETLGNFS